MLLEEHDAILSDLDGVVYAGPHAIPGAVEALNRAQAEQVPVIYVTNNASRTVDRVAEHLQELGLKTGPEYVISSAQVAAELLGQQLSPGEAVQVTGSAALADCLRQVGLKPVRSTAEAPVALVQGFDPGLGWADLAEAAYTLADPAVIWVATNTDWTIPQERGIAPGNGTLVNAVAKASGRTPRIAGKPQAPIFTSAASRVGSSKPLVLGDRLDTDILGGNRAGMASACVLTGVDTYETLLAAPRQQRPKYVLASLADLFLPYLQIELVVDQAGSRARGAGYEAQASGNTLEVRGKGKEIDLWRVACAAWWAAHPDLLEALAPQEFNRG